MMPFWFLNDALDEQELLRQIKSFQDNGIDGFVVHPRVGLPRDTGWMSARLLHFIGVILAEAERRGMQVILYDEGMYPSGASAGQVVEENPAFACRGLLPYAQCPNPLPTDWHVVAEAKRVTGERVYIIDRPLGSWIRGLHYTGDDNLRSPNGWEIRDTPEYRPPAADLLNPASVACFIRKVYQRYHDTFARYFGQTIIAIFTDEPMVLGRGHPEQAMPGTRDILSHVRRLLGYDFTPHLPALWHDDEPDAARHRQNYRYAIQQRLQETYYAQISDWCDRHNTRLTGHPATPQDIGHLRHFHWPGQDNIWRDILPGEKSVTGVESLTAKCAASAALHLGRRRNANEFLGAYGPDVPLSLYRFVAWWLVLRGCNLLIPHAYFYSIRGPRIDECPPQLGPHSPWWNTPQLREFHDAARRLSWLNTDSTPQVSVAVVCQSGQLPLLVARTLFEHQVDFHYLEQPHLWQDAVVTPDGVTVGAQHYAAIIVDDHPLDDRARIALQPLDHTGRLVKHDPINPHQCLTALGQWVRPTVITSSPQPWLRARRVRKAGWEWVMLLNEGIESIDTTLDLGDGDWHEVEPSTGTLGVRYEISQRCHLESGAMRLFARAVA